MRILLVLCVLYTLFSVIECGFSTKTSYRRYHNENEKNMDPIIPHGYRFHYFYGVFRHGNRYSSLNKLKKINSTLETISSTSYDINRLQRLFSSLAIDQNYSLNAVGAFYTYNIGRRFAKRLSGSKFIRNENMQFASTYKSRAFLSMASFSLGFSHGGWISNQRVLHRDQLEFLRFFDICPKYSIAKSRAKEMEKSLLKNNLFQNVSVKVSRRISNSSEFKMSVDDVMNLYDFCAMCHAQYHDGDPDCPCEFFDQDDLEILEYANDMILFYEKGDGFAINLDIAVNHVMEIVKRVERQAKTCHLPGSKEKMDAYFGHAETLLPIIGRFGLLDIPESSTELDYDLTPENFYMMKGKNRLFRGEKFVPFAGNLVFVVACPERRSMSYKGFGFKLTYSEMNKPRVIAFLNEKNIPLRCGMKKQKKDSLYSCTVENFVKSFTPNVTFDQVCNSKCSSFNCRTNSIKYSSNEAM